MVPGDRWILGQKVRYLVEAGRPQAADSIGVACAARATVRATTSWCLALVGYTAQQFANYPRADAAFTSALAEMPESERGKWEDLALLLGGRAAKPYRRGDGEPRDSLTAAFWRLVQPLYLTNVNDLRTEFLARITRMYIEQDSRTAMSDSWSADDRETLLRYGVALWYTQGEVRRGSIGPPEIAGIRRVPSFNFFPDAHVFASPDQLTPERLGVWERREQADLRASMGRQLSAAHRSIRSRSFGGATRHSSSRRSPSTTTRRSAKRDGLARSRPSSIVVASFSHSERRSRRRASAWCRRWWRHGAR